MYWIQAALTADIVIAFHERLAAKLRDLQPPAVLSVSAGQPLQRDHSVNDAVELTLDTLRCAIVQQQDHARAAIKVAFQRERLPPAPLPATSRARSPWPSVPPCAPKA